MSTEIALFGNKGSPQVAEIAEAVAALGGEPVVLDIQLGGTGRSVMALGDGAGEPAARWNGVDFTDIRAIHIRCTSPRTLPTLPPVLNDLSHAEYRADFVREQAFNAATYAFFDALAAQGKLVVNPLSGVYVDHNSKGQFYEKLRAAGFRVPRSLSTNDPETARRFLGEVGEAVMKPAIGVGSTRVVTEDDRARLDEVARCPVLFQERVVGDTVRIHIVGDTVVLALRILAEGVDSRTATKGFAYVELDPAEAAAIVRANRFLGLHYAAWDAIATEDNRLHYLDCNPGPFVMWLPEDYRRAVFHQLAGYLLRFAREGSVAAAAAAVEPYRPH